MERLNQAIERLSKLDMSPGLQVGRNESIPDHAGRASWSRADGSDEFVVRLADSHLPGLRLNRRTCRWPRTTRSTKRRANSSSTTSARPHWIIEAIEQRQEHAAEGRPGHRPAPAGLLRARSALSAAAADVQGGRGGGRPLGHGLAGRLGQVHAVRLGHPAAAQVLQRRHRRRQRRGPQLGGDPRQAPADHRRGRQEPSPSTTTRFARSWPRPASPTWPGERSPNTAS